MVWWGRILAETLCPCFSSYPRPHRLYFIQPCLTSIPAVQYISFVMYQTQISMYCPHICHGRRSLQQWCSGCCPILSWINTGAICRLADTEMFVFQTNPPLSLYSNWPLPSQLQRGRDGESLQLYKSLWSAALSAVIGLYGVSSVRAKF